VATVVHRNLAALGAGTGAGTGTNVIVDDDGSRIRLLVNRLVGWLVGHLEFPTVLEVVVSCFVVRYECFLMLFNSIRKKRKEKKMTGQREEFYFISNKNGKTNERDTTTSEFCFQREQPVSTYAPFGLKNQK